MSTTAADLNTKLHGFREDAIAALVKNTTADGSDAKSTTVHVPEQLVAALLKSAGVTQDKRGRYIVPLPGGDMPFWEQDEALKYALALIAKR